MPHSALDAHLVTHTETQSHAAGSVRSPTHNVNYGSEQSLGGACDEEPKQIMRL